MPWYQRKIAATIFADPPESSYEEVKSALFETLLDLVFKNDHWHHNNNNNNNKFYFTLVLEITML